MLKNCLFLSAMSFRVVITVDQMLLTMFPPFGTHYSSEWAEAM